MFHIPATNVGFFLNWRKYGSEATQKLCGILQGGFKKLEIFLLFIIVHKMQQLTCVYHHGESKVVYNDLCDCLCEYVVIYVI